MPSKLALPLAGPFFLAEAIGGLKEAAVINAHPESLREGGANRGLRSSGQSFQFNLVGCGIVD